MKKNQKPDWFENQNKKQFACFISKGVKEINKRNIKNIKRVKLSIDDYYNGIISKDRTILAKAITLIESNKKEDNKKANILIEKLLPLAGKSLRIGISGIPGAGKSTFIDTFGSLLCEKNYKVAVLAVDPSSSISKGSILADKTRMDKLLNCQNAFIRPSPSSGNLGGVAKKTREAILLCEAFGFDIIIIETVGVGQSEITTKSMVDFFILLLTSGTGDEIQGIKKGIVEISDAILINKADGDNLEKAVATKNYYQSALRLFNFNKWEPIVETCSAIMGFGINEIWSKILEYEKIMKENNSFYENRNKQAINWFYSILDENIKNKFYNNSKNKKLIKSLSKKILSSKITVISAISSFIK